MFQREGDLQGTLSPSGDICVMANHEAESAESSIGVAGIVGITSNKGQTALQITQRARASRPTCIHQQGAIVGYIVQQEWGWLLGAAPGLLLNFS